MAILVGDETSAVTQGPTMSFDGVEDFVGLWIALKRIYIERRGFTVGVNTKAIPRTKLSDVMRLAAEWTRELKRASDRPGFHREKEKWQDILGQVDLVAQRIHLDEVYPHNQRFWDASSSLAIYLDSTKNLPSRWNLIVESVGESIGELPRTLEQAARSTVNTAADAARRVAVGTLGLLRGLSTPILVGVAVLAALFLLPRFDGGRR